MTYQSTTRFNSFHTLWACLATIVLISGTLIAGPTQVQTTLEDFFMPGTQPGMLTVPIESISNCTGCHAGYDPVAAQYESWVNSMMGQTARDPLYLASLAIANQDAAFAGDLCLRCHTPGGWLAGHSTPTDGSAMTDLDLEGINCNFCHRMVDPIYAPGISPIEDEPIVASILPPVLDPHSGGFIIDPLDRRRGPFDLDNFNSHAWLQSSFTQDSSYCATCHDVSNPAFDRQPDGTYSAIPLGQAPLSQSKYDQFPVERTYSEWLGSAFSHGPVEMNGRFGGNITAVSSCQDCHMPDTTGRGCNRNSRPIRDDLPTHQFIGGNTWVLDAVRGLQSDTVTGLTAAGVATNKQHTYDMLTAAADLDATQSNSTLTVRVTNQGGHKLPTGYPEGRRMWLNIKYFDESQILIEESGHYDDLTATLTTSNTIVYEAILGVDAAVSSLTGIPEGESFHFAVNNVWLKDNRIPPRGFNNALSEQLQTTPVGHIYDDGQHWDDVEYDIPSEAASVQVSLMYQTSSREYIEFLRDENHTDNTGLELYNQWLATGMGAPYQMLSLSLPLDPIGGCPADLNSDGSLDFFDISAFLSAFTSEDPAADFNNDGSFNFFDVSAFLAAFTSGCP
jgi:hypothetical protein